jgi:hypothetical protein
VDPRKRSAARAASLNGTGGTVTSLQLFTHQKKGTQIMAYNNTIRQDVFKRLGVYIKWWYELDDMKATLDALLGDASTSCTAIKEFKLGGSPSAEDKQAYEAVSIEIRRQKDELESLRQSVINLTSGFIGLNVKALINSPYSTPDAILDHLLDAMDDYDDQVLQNTVSIGDIIEDEDNSVKEADGLSLDFGVDATQKAHADRFVLTCVDATTVNNEHWSLESAILGQYAGVISTGQSLEWAEAGIAGLSIPAAPTREGSDVSSKISDWKLGGAVRGSNVTADGRLYLKFAAAPTLTRTNDELSQLTSFSFSTAVFGTESDVEGKLYASVVKEPAVADVLGGVTAQILKTDLIIDGATSSNTDNGTLYAKVIKSTSSGTSTYTVELYKDSARTQKVATGSDTAAEDEVPTAAIVLSQSSSSGITGKLTLGAFVSVEDSTDQSILIKVPIFFIRLYRSAGRDEADMVAQGVAYQPKPAGSVSISSATGYTTAGTVSLNYIQDNQDIVLSGVFYTVDAYRMDPASASTDDIVARAGKLSNLLTGAASDLPFFEVNSSGLHGVSVDVAAVTVSGGYTASAYAGFANGDTFTFETSASGSGRFQTFLRDNFGKIFPATSSGNEIDEAWAGV